MFFRLLEENPKLYASPSEWAKYFRGMGQYLADVSECLSRFASMLLSFVQAMDCPNPNECVSPC